MQLEYASRTVGCEGYKSDSSPSNVVSCINADTVEIGIGSLVAFADKEQVCVLAKNKEDRIAGVVLGDWRAASFKPGDTLSVLRQGRVFVRLDNDVKKAGEPVFVSPTGKFGSKSEGAFLLSGACFMTAGPKDQIIEMEINLLGGNK